MNTENANENAAEAIHTTLGAIFLSLSSAARLGW